MEEEKKEENHAWNCRKCFSYGGRSEHRSAQDDKGGGEVGNCGIWTNDHGGKEGGKKRTF